MSKRAMTGKTSSYITVEEAAGILGVGQDVIQIRFANRSLTKLRAPNGEVRLARDEVARLAESLKPVPMLPGESRDEYIARIVAGFPPPSAAQLDKVWALLGLGGSADRGPREPSAYELEQRRKENERLDALKKAKKAAEAMTACDVCNLQPEVHGIRRSMGADMHDWQPGRAEKLLKRAPKKATT